MKRETTEKQKLAFEKAIQKMTEMQREKIKKKAI
jgi:hypothetical protein